MLQKLTYWILFVSGMFLLQTPLLATTESIQTTHRILVFGDSLSAAYNIQREQGWVSLLQDFVDNKNLPIEITNASISGETTSGGLTRLNQQLDKFKPTIVILELGGNDGLRGFNLAETEQNLTQMIDQSLAQGATVLLAGMQLPPNMGRTYTSRFAAIYTQLAERDGVFLIPSLLADIAIRKELMQADGIHPNVDGQPLIMQKVWQHLQPIICP